MTVGFIIGNVLVMIHVIHDVIFAVCTRLVALLGYNLTDSPIMINQYDSYVKDCSLTTFIKYVRILDFNS